MSTQSFNNTVLSATNALLELQMAAQQQSWIEALVGAKLADEATLRELLSLDAVAPRKRGRPAGGGKGKAKAKACSVPDDERCLGCKWGGGDLTKARCSGAGVRDDQLCTSCGTNWDVIWADRKADGRVSYGSKSATQPVAWFGFWGVDRLPVWPGELHCVMAKPGAKSNSGNGVHLGDSQDAAAGGSRKRGVWHKAREAWCDTEVPAAAPKEEEQTEDPTVLPEHQTVDRDGLAYVTAKVWDADTEKDITWAWPAGDWLKEAGYCGTVVVDLADPDTACAQVNEDGGDLMFTDAVISNLHDIASDPDA